jgi:hypothetical protein
MQMCPFSSPFETRNSKIETRKKLSAVSFQPGFPFGILNPSSIHPPTRAQLQFRTPGASAPFGGQVRAFKMESTGTLTGFPYDFFEHLVIPLFISLILLSPSFLPIVFGSAVIYSPGMRGGSCPL